MASKPDHTEYTALDRCEQEWVWRHHRKLRPAVPSAPAQMGQLIHAGVQALYAERPMDPAYAVAATLRNEMELVEYAQAVTRLYAAQWFAEGKPKGCDVVWNEGYAESALESAIPDRCVRWHVDGKLYAMDLKTTSLFISAAWQRHFEHNQQVAIQLDVLEAVLGERVEGFVLDALYLPKYKGVYKLPGAHDFARHGPIVYSEALREELRAQRARKRETLRTLRMFPELAEKRTESCMRYNRLCPYFALCHADPEDREALVQIQLGKGELEEGAWEPKNR